MQDDENFETVDINSFFDSTPKEDDSEKIEMVTVKQKKLINDFLPLVKNIDYQKYLGFKNRLNDLDKLAQAMAVFPSLLERHELVGGERTPTSLIDIVPVRECRSPTFTTFFFGLLQEKSVSVLNNEAAAITVSNKCFFISLLS